MRNLNQDILNIKQGLEPVTIIGIQWYGIGYANESYYGDRDYPDALVAGKILNLPELDTGITADGTGVVQSITVKLDDSDGSILKLMNTHDIYLAPVNVYQWFNGYSINFKAKIFEGLIVGPISYDEGGRFIEIQATTRLTNIQVGFSYDETNTDILHQSLIGKVWPLTFGTPIHYPALQLQEIPSGITTIPFGVPDPSIFWQIAKLNYQIQLANAPYQKLIESLTDAKARFGSKNQDTFNSYYVPLLQAEMKANAKGLEDQIDVLVLQYAEQAQYMLTNNVILGGYKFPQRIPLKCKIGDQLFTCTFLGNPTDVITNPNQACPVHMVPYYLPGFPNNAGSADPSARDYSFNFPSLISQYTGNISIPVPQISSVTANPGGLGGSQGGVSGSIGGSAIPPLALEYPVIKQGFTWVSPGSSLTLIDDFNFKFLVSYVPGTVVNVYAYRSYNGLRKLTQVPPRYYTIETQGNITFINMGRPLSIISYLIEQRTTEAEDYVNQVASDFNGFVKAHVVTNVDWEDQIYVTFQSSIGPNIVDILIWLILNYTPYNYDLTTFNSVRSQVDNYPANFVIMDRPLVDQLMNEICYQSRCSLVLKGGVYYIKYLSAQPTAVGYVDFDHIEENSLKVTTTPVEELVTRYTATWRPDYSPDYENANKVILKNNHLRYGFIDYERDFFIYNQFYLVQKSALFWLLRTSNVFKIVSFTVFLDHLNLEAQDAIILDFGSSDGNGVFADFPVTSLITNQVYDSDNHSISLTCWTPIKLGQMSPYLFAWPAGLVETDYYYPNQLTTSGGTLGYSPGNVPPPPAFNAIQKQQIDYSNWPEDPGDLFGYNQGLAAWASQADANSRATQASNDQANADEQANGTPGAQRSTPVHVSDIGNPVNNANQRNTNIPVLNAEATLPKNPKLSPDYSVSPTGKPTIPSGGAGSTSGVFPARVTSGGGFQYQCTIYINGLDNDPISAPATEVHNDPTLGIGAGIWVTAIQIGNAYYIIQPSWSI